MRHLLSRAGVVAGLTAGLLMTYAQAQDAAATYKGKCAVCHGADGKGSPMGIKLGASDLTSADVQQQTDTQLTGVITKGKGKMPGFEDRLKDTEIKDLVAFIRTLAKK
jgi:cytochrome c6